MSYISALWNIHDKQQKTNQVSIDVIQGCISTDRSGPETSSLFPLRIAVAAGVSSQY